MNKFIRAVVSVFIVFFLAFVVFFYWASSSVYTEKEYARLITNTYNYENSSDSIYSIMTYNIGYLSGMTNNLPIQKTKELFDTNLNHIRLKVKGVSPDIMALQEIDYHAARSFHVDQEQELSSLGYNYVARAVNWDKRYLPFPYWPPKMHFGKVLSGQSVISKYPIKAHERVVLDRVEDTPFFRDAFYLERLAQVCKVILNGKEVVIINVHLEAFDKPTRKKQFDYILEVFKKQKKQYPTILLGDFNSRARDTTAIIQEIMAMEDVGTAAFDDSNIANTFDTKAPYERIDYIFYSENSIAYFGGRVLNEFGQVSDHLPVLMRFKLK